MWLPWFFSPFHNVIVMLRTSAVGWLRLICIDVLVIVIVASRWSWTLPKSKAWPELLPYNYSQEHNVKPQDMPRISLKQRDSLELNFFIVVFGWRCLKPCCHCGQTSIISVEKTKFASCYNWVRWENKWLLSFLSIFVKTIYGCFSEVVYPCTSNLVQFIFKIIFI